MIPRKKMLQLTMTGVLMAINMMLSLSFFSLHTPVGNLYLCNVIITVAGVLLDPAPAFVVGGIGAFLGDLLAAYPQAMFVSLVSHGLQAVVISLFFRHVLKKHPAASSALGAVLGALIMAAGYTFGRTFIYGQQTFAYALVKLPAELLQGAIGVGVGLFLLWGCRIYHIFQKTALE